MKAPAQLKQLLNELEYPNISLMTDEELCEIFNSSNRIFLVSWAVRQLDLEEELPKEQNKLVSHLANLICDFGFCGELHKTKFVTANPELEIKIQVRIIQRMLHYVKCITKPREMTSFPIGTEEIGELIKNDLNLFPLMGRIQYYEPEHSVAAMDEEIDDLRSEIAVLEAELASPIPSEVQIPDSDLSKLESSVHDLERELGVIAKITSKAVSRLSFNEDFSSDASSCHDMITTVATHFNSLKNLGAFDGNRFEPSDNIKIKDFQKELHALSALSKDVISNHL